MNSIILVTLLILSVSTSPVPREKPTCLVCHSTDPNKINVHLIAHSHDDLGWLKTVDQYYYGSHNEIQAAGVQYIISSTVEALKANPDRRYIQVETGFLYMWWQHQTEQVRQDFINLVNNGQIEMVNAAWSMNDEANTHYQSIIDQFTWGLRFINDTLGKCGIPRIGWQIDPFGHSREQAFLFSRLGYDGVFFARLDFLERKKRSAERNMEVVWKASDNIEDSFIFTNAFPEALYFPPGGFCFDGYCGDEVVNDDKSSPGYNVPRRVADFTKYVRKFAAYYKTSNVLIPMGGDFHYQEAFKNFINIDKLIDGFKNDEDINMIYSTPSCYLQAVYEESVGKNIGFNIKTDDFFPYGSDYNDYWSGYFTSRPNAKRFERIANNILQGAKQLVSFGSINGANYDRTLDKLRQALGVLQHHDAITGTAKRTVAKDYSRMLAIGLSEAIAPLGSIIGQLLRKDDSVEPNLPLTPCLLSNVSICEPASANRFIAAVYNPLARPVTYYVRIPVPPGTYRITADSKADEVQAEVLNSISSFSYMNDALGRPNPKELVFATNELPPLAIRLYYIERTGNEAAPVAHSAQSYFGTKSVGFEIDVGTGLLKSVTMNGITLEIRQEFRYYKGANGNNSVGDLQASGAYIFRPLEQQSYDVSNGKVTYTSTTGELVDEVRQAFSDSVTQIIRVYKDEDNNYIEFDWLVGPIEIDEENGIGREIISKFIVNNFDNEGVFYTDSNGRQMMKRQRNKRIDFEYDPSIEPVASNYYPVTSKIAIKDEQKKIRVAVLNDRAQGGSSIEDGTLELMVHRRLLRDDGKGVNEPLNDIEFGQGIVARGQFYLIIGPDAEAPNTNGLSTMAQERDLALKKQLQPLILIGDATKEALSLANLQEKYHFTFDGMQNALPQNVHLLTLEPWKDQTLLLRVEHIMEKGEDSNLSGAPLFNINAFETFELTNVQETTLGANQWLHEYQEQRKYEWNVLESDKKATNRISVRSNATTAADPHTAFLAFLYPMEIRTFIVDTRKK